MRSEEVADGVRTDRALNRRLSVTIEDCLWLAPVGPGVARRLMVVKALRLGTWWTRDGIVSKMHLTTRPHIRHILGEPANK